MIPAPQPVQTSGRTAAAPADALARLIGGGAAEAKVVAIEAGGLVRLLLDNVPMTIAAPKGLALHEGDQVLLKPRSDGAGGRTFDLQRLDRAAAPPTGAPLAPAVQVAAHGVATAIDAHADHPGPPPATGARPSAGPADEAIDLPNAREILTPMARDALARQAPLPRLMAHLAASLAGPRLYWPPEVRTAIGDLLSRALDPAAPTIAKDLKHAVEESGVFLESSLSKGAPRVLAHGDLKADLLQLRSLLAGLAASRPGEEASRRPAASTPSEPSSPPPLRGRIEPMQPAPVAAGFDHAASAHDQAVGLLREVEGAIDRLKLLQFASLNDPPRLDDPQRAAQGQRQWQVEIPINFHGPTALPLTVERDGAGGGDPAIPAPAWRMRFSVETRELGRIDITVGWRGGRIDVLFRADRADTARLIAAGEKDLSESLAASAVPLDAIRCHEGRSVAPVDRRPARQGQFVDCRS